MYALIEIKGKQYKAEKGGVLKVDLFENDKGSSLELEKVVLLSTDSGVRFGSPYIEGVKVRAVVEDHGRDKKILGFKYKKRKNYRRSWGHRQWYTLLKVEDIAGVSELS
ncbi:MAG: 50S ribosomal protein L21 [Spirochaetales bacterium]|nr:50S ribosomal protein L21 [Spirochaetales bacterium]